MYDQLQADCGKLETCIKEEEVELLVSQIVKDQLGLEKCLDVLREIIKKYEAVLRLAMEMEEADVLFLGNMKKGVADIIGNAKILLSKGFVKK